MSKQIFSKSEIDRFIREEIETVPQLEALLLFWRRSPSHWTCHDLAEALYVSPVVAEQVLLHLVSRHWIVEVPAHTGHFSLIRDAPEKEALLAALDTIYRQDLLRISRMIHENSSPGLRDFARSFRIKKD